MKGKTMDMKKAIEALGSNRARYEVQNMALALTFGSYLNTKEERERLDASAYVLKRWKAYAKACDDIRTARYTRPMGRA
jgi:hypothetical protein